MLLGRRGPLDALEAHVYPKKCGECGARVATSDGSIPVELRGETVNVDGVEHGRCTQCGEVFLGLDAAERLQREAVRRLRASHGLLGPEEIRSLRRSLHLSQATLEKLLGVGPKTVVRWEKGTVFQSATADRLMRLLMVMPELKSVLSGGELYARSSATDGRERREPEQCLGRAQKERRRAG